MGMKRNLLGSGDLRRILIGTDGVQYHCIDFSILDVVECALSQGDDVAMVYFGLHGVAGDIAPEAGFFESPYYDVGGGYVYLRVEHLIESPQ